MKKILIITSSIDFTVDYIINKYGTTISFYRINVDYFHKYKFILHNSDEWTIESKSWDVSLTDINAIYYRKPRLPDLKDYKCEYRDMISKDIISLINGMVDSFKGIVLTKPFLLKKVENKIYQIKVAKENNLQIPESLITNSIDTVNELIREEKCIIKPLTTGKTQSDQGVRIYQTTIVREIMDDILKTPIYVQEYIEKSYELRITIVNDKIYPVKIEAFNKVDWRVDEIYNKYTLIDIPEDIKRKCLLLMNEMELKFGAFDFIVDKDQRYIFLEVNPNGQWLWLEEKLDLDISKSIIDYLCGGIYEKNTV